MIERGKVGTRFFVIGVALAATIFLFDVLFPLGVAAGVPYVAIMMVGLWAPGKRYILGLATICTALIVVGYVYSPQGGIPWLAFTNRALVVVAIWITAILIGKHKQAEEALWDSEARLKTTLNNLLEGVITIDEKGIIHSFNPAAERMFGYAAEEVIGGNVNMLMPEPDRGGHDGYIRSYLETGEAKIIGRAREVTGRRKDGTTFPLNLGIAEMRLGERRFYVGTLDDITERKVNEESLRQAKEQADLANLAKSEFLTTMSHELRTPLNAVLGFAEIMQQQIYGPLGHPKYGEYIDDIHESGRHLLGLINDILDVSRIETGQTELSEVWLDVGVVVESSVRLVREKANHASLELLTMVNDDTPLLFADERRVKQILLNLLSNALKFTPKGGRVSVDAGIDEGGGCFLSVSDTGIGIAPEDVDKVLSPFGQVDSSLSRRHEGSGLGLPLAKSLVELHGGTLDLDSEAGIGTTVAAKFPARRTKPNRHRPAKRSGGNGMKHTTKRSVRRGTASAAL